LLRANDEETFAIGWSALAALELTRLGRDDRRIEYLKYLPALAEEVIGRFPPFHHTAKGLFPGEFADLISDGGEFPIPFWSFVQAVRIHAHFTITECSAVQELSVGLASDVRTRQWRRATRGDFEEVENVA